MKKLFFIAAVALITVGCAKKNDPNIHMFTVTFDLNDGTGSIEVLVESGNLVDVP